MRRVVQRNLMVPPRTLRVHPNLKCRAALCTKPPKAVLATTPVVEAAKLPLAERLRASLPPILLERLSLLSHFSNVCRFGGLAMTDLLYLQSFMLVASATNGLYNLLQKKPLYTPAIYSALFAVFSGSIVLKIASERLY